MTQQQPLKLCFEDTPFPVVEGSERNSKTYRLLYEDEEFPVTVSLCELAISDGSTLTGIITSPLILSKNLPMSGAFTSCYLDEAKAMLKVANQYCADHHLKICQIYNNWPKLRASVNSIRSDKW